MHYQLGPPVLSATHVLGGQLPVLPTLQVCLTQYQDVAQGTSLHKKRMHRKSAPALPPREPQVEAPNLKPLPCKACTGNGHRWASRALHLTLQHNVSIAAAGRVVAVAQNVSE